MKLLSVLKGAKWLGRTALGAGAVGTGLTFGDGSLVELVSELAVLVGAITEGAIRFMVVRAKLSGKLPMDANL